MLPNFMKKYEANLDFKEDGSLECGIEFTMEKPKYMTGLTNALKFLEVFSGFFAIKVFLVDLAYFLPVRPLYRLICKRVSVL